MSEQRPTYTIEVATENGHTTIHDVVGWATDVDTGWFIVEGTTDNHLFRLDSVTWVIVPVVRAEEQ